MPEELRNLAFFMITLIVPAGLTIMWERSAAARMAEAPDELSEVALASVAEDEYCSVGLKKVLRRVAGACGLLEGEGRGCKPADAKQVASVSGSDFNALFNPLKHRAHILQFDAAQTELDDMAKTEVEKAWADQRGASFFFVVSRASQDGDAVYNQQLSAARAEAVLNHLDQKFQDEELKKQVGLLWLGEEYAQLGSEFCDWERSRSAVENDACSQTEINRSAFVAWIDCAI